MPEIYVGNTDNNWFDFLRFRQPWEEVNFWKPTPKAFRAIEEGGLFAFRLKSARAKIGGYGILASAIDVPIQFAWDGLGEANGCASLEELFGSIKRYRNGADITSQSLFGCRVLIEPVFLTSAIGSRFRVIGLITLFQGKPTVQRLMQVACSMKC